jgi:hypothetical protein
VDRHRQPFGGESGEGDLEHSLPVAQGVGAQGTARAVRANWHILYVRANWHILYVRAS